MDARKRISKWIVAGVYLFLISLVLWPLIDLLTNVWPPQLGTLQWRYGFMGLMAAFLNTPILALILAMAFAFVMQHRRVLRAIAILELLGALALLLVILTFALDVVQMRGTMQPEQLGAFQAGALIAELKHLVAFAVLSLLGVGTWKSSGHRRTDGKKDEAVGVVIGSG